MATLTIKNIPDRLRKRRKESATEHRRSINSEATSCLWNASRCQAGRLLNRISSEGKRRQEKRHPQERTAIQPLLSRSSSV